MDAAVFVRAVSRGHVDRLFMSLLDNLSRRMYDDNRCLSLRQEIDSRGYFAEVRLKKAMSEPLAIYPADAKGRAHPDIVFLRPFWCR